MTTYPSYDELPIRADYPPGSSWGVFGEADQVGTLNFITEEHVAAATRLVTTGRSFSLNWSMEFPTPPLFGRKSYIQRVMTYDDGGTDDGFDQFYPQASSQWDALCHIRHPQYGYYNGVADEDTPGFGGSSLDIAQWGRRGIAGRFVLVDVAGHRARTGAGLDCADSVPVTVAEIDVVLEAQGTRVESGDILLLHFGWTAWYEQASAETRAALAVSDQFSTPGLALSEDSARWLWDHRVAALAADTPAVEVMPFTTGPADGFLHYRLIPLLGLAIGEMFDLASLAEHCRTSGRYEGLFVSSPFNIPGGVGSTANAHALM